MGRSTRIKGLDAMVLTLAEEEARKQPHKPSRPPLSTNALPIRPLGRVASAALSPGSPRPSKIQHLINCQDVSDALNDFLTRNPSNSNEQSSLVGLDSPEPTSSTSESGSDLDFDESNCPGVMVSNNVIRYASFW